MGMYHIGYDIVYNNVKGSSLNILPVRRPDIPAPEYEHEEIVIPGRDGIMTGSKRLLPIELSVEFNFLSTSPNLWMSDFRAAKNWLKGSGRLEFSDDEDFFFKVYFVRIEDSVRDSRRKGSFTAVFVCDPYMYLKKGDREYSLAQVQNNPYELAHPTYILRGYSESTILTVNGTAVELSVDGMMVLDTDLMQAYDQDGSLANTSVIGDYADLYLQPGKNELLVSSGGMTVIPNWRTL